MLQKIIDIRYVLYYNKYNYKIYLTKYYTRGVQKWKKKTQRKVQNVYTADIMKAITQKDYIVLNVPSKVFANSTRS